MENNGFSNIEYRNFQTVYQLYILDGKYNVEKSFQLFKIARKLSTSGAVDTIDQIYNLPMSINFFLALYLLVQKIINFKQ